MGRMFNDTQLRAQTLPGKGMGSPSHCSKNLGSSLLLCHFNDFFFLASGQSWTLHWVRAALALGGNLDPGTERGSWQRVL
jgi:hypothetical protein